MNTKQLAFCSLTLPWRRLIQLWLRSSCLEDLLQDLPSNPKDLVEQREYLKAEWFLWFAYLVMMVR